MAPGDYVFNTDDKEKMTVISGTLTVKLPESENKQTFSAGESFKEALNNLGEFWQRQITRIKACELRMLIAL